MAAYFYKIRERDTGRLYVGCQYSDTADSNNLLVSYKTSCKYIRDKGAQAFEILKIAIRPNARELERRYLRYVFHVLGRETFEIEFINRNLAPGIIFTRDIRARMSLSLKKAAARRRAAGTLKPTFLGRCHTQTTRKLLSDMAIMRIKEKGHPRGMQGKQHSDTTKEQIRQTGIMNSAMRGKVGSQHPTGDTIWWNDGESHKRSKECPGLGWAMGRIFKKRTKRKRV